MSNKRDSDRYRKMLDMINDFSELNQPTPVVPYPDVDAFLNHRIDGQHRSKAMNDSKLHYAIDFGMNGSQTVYSFIAGWTDLYNDAINKSMEEQIYKNIMEMFGLSPFDVDGVHVTMTLIDVARGRNAGWPWMKTLSKELAGRLPWTPFEENGVTRV